MPRFELTNFRESSEINNNNNNKYNNKKNLPGLLRIHSQPKSGVARESRNHSKIGQDPLDVDGSKMVAL